MTNASRTVLVASTHSDREERSRVRKGSTIERVNRRDYRVRCLGRTVAHGGPAA